MENLMIKTKYWLSLLAISVVLVAGSLAVSPIAIAGDDEDDDDEDDKASLDDVLAALGNLQSDVDGIDTSGLATQSSVDDVLAALGNLQSDVDDLKTQHVISKNILCGIATSPDGCLGP